MIEPDGKRLGLVDEATPTGHCAVEAACVHKIFDQFGVPRSDLFGKTYSLWGRICRYKEGNFPVINT